MHLYWPPLFLLDTKAGRHSGISPIPTHVVDVANLAKVVPWHRGRNDWGTGRLGDWGSGWDEDESVRKWEDVKMC